MRVKKSSAARRKKDPCGPFCYFDFLVDTGLARRALVAAFWRFRRALYFFWLSRRRIFGDLRLSCLPMCIESSKSARRHAGREGTLLKGPALKSSDLLI